jgi:hypothetical protein
LGIEVGVGASVTPRELRFHKIESSLGHSTCVRDHVIFVLELLTQRT